MPRDLARDLEDRELVGPGGEAAEAAEVVEFVENDEHRVVGGLLGEVLELGTGDRPQAAAAPSELVGGGS